MTNKGSLAALPRSLQTHHRRSYATALSGKSWAGTSSDGTAAKLLIDGAWEQSGSSQHVDVLDPSTQKMVSRVPITSQAEMSRILRSSATAYESWKDSSVLTRQRIMLE